jgi:hypothetical protein
VFLGRQLAKRRIQVFVDHDLEAFHANTLHQIEI